MTAPREAGFSLAEALVALAIIAALSAAMLQTLADTTRRHTQVEQRRRAAMVAQSALARIAAGDRSDSGQDGDLSWHATRQPYDAGGRIGAGSSFAVAAPLEHVAVSVEDSAHHRLLTLASVRIAP